MPLRTSVTTGASSSSSIAAPPIDERKTQMIRGRNAKKKSNSVSTASKITSKTKGKKNKEEKSKVRNEKVRNAGARLGGLLRSSLSLSRKQSKSKSSLLSEATVASNEQTSKATAITKAPPSNEQIDNQRLTNRRRSRSNHRDKPSDSDRFNRSVPPNRRSEQSMDFLYVDEECPMEAFEGYDQSYNSETIMEGNAKEEKTHSEARPKISLESRKSIERKQAHARLRSRSREKNIYRTTSGTANTTQTNETTGRSELDTTISESYLNESVSSLLRCTSSNDDGSLASATTPDTLQLYCSDLDNSFNVPLSPFKQQRTIDGKVKSPRARSLSMEGEETARSFSISSNHEGNASSSNQQKKTVQKTISGTGVRARSKSLASHHNTVTKTRSMSMRNNRVHSESPSRHSKPSSHSRPRSSSPSQQLAMAKNCSPSMGPVLERSRSYSMSIGNERVDGDRSQSPSCRYVLSRNCSLGNKSSKHSSSDFDDTPVNDDDLEWHCAILKHDWVTIEGLLKSYDHTKYREDSNGPERYEKKSRVTMKFLPKNQEEKQQKLVGSEEDQASNAAISPLLQVDSKGRTPLHLACKEYMPSKQLQRLLFVERNAAGIKDKDGRYPLHVALINNLHQQVVDRLIRAVPDALGRPDCLNCTPMQYAVLKAEYFRDKEMASMTWGYPSTVDEAKWQKQQIEAWDNVKFILETMISRRKPLSLTHERNLLVESVGFYAPPVIVNHMLTVGGRVLLKEEAMSKQILTLIFRLQYPIRLTKRVLKVTSKVLPKSYILDVIRNGLIDHFDRGFTPSTFGENGNHRKISSGKELLEYYRRKSLGEEASLTIEAQEWWDKLRFFIAFASCRFHDDTDDIILHAALTNPESPPGLIEFLCRLFPSTRFDVDLSTDALPLHLACIYWDPAAGGVQNEIEYTRVLNLLMAGDFSLVRSLSNNRLALHHAIISGKPLPFIRTLIALDKKTASVPDPVTRLLPFELAALPEYNLNKDHQSQSSKDLQQLELIFELLRSSPFALSLLVSPKDKEANPLTRHVLHWCYDWSFSGWSINTRRKDLIRQAISKGKIPEQMRQWWSVLKTLIWRAANELDGGSSRNPMCDTPQTREFLLHAALWNASKIPPIAIELIVEVYPASAFSKQPGTGLIPLQIAAQAQSYKSFPFESTISLSSSLEMMTLLDSDGLVAKSEAGQLPLHMAIGSGKTWAELRTMVEAAPETLSVLDPSTGLLPFQQAACKDCFIPSHRIVCAGTTFAQWDKQRPEENAKVLRALCDGYERDKLTTIFELLRAKPAVLSTSGK